ncbi:hypothetical protein [Pelagibaculum spongiae]|uniref:Uncharacterized protein n=1 Tax=Pelagibaculum spongiae TaxID=2080658 RepID=A0A2V1GTS5_9GAMM|nr:hypothetical protein [Pelagibaculum spongiae]PVZ65472.1 hypothetical protein DC094_18510 [Pelagibaculum spongiae]
MKKKLLALSLLASAGLVQAQQADHARYSCDIENYAGIDTSSLTGPPTPHWYVSQPIIRNVPWLVVDAQNPLIAIWHVTYLSPSQGLSINLNNSSVTLNFEDGTAQTVAVDRIEISELASPLISYEINISFEIVPDDGESYTFTYSGDNLVQGILNELPNIEWDIIDGVSTDVTPTISCIDHKIPDPLTVVTKKIDRLEVLHPELAIFDLPLNEAIESLPGPQRYSAYRYQAGEMTKHWAIERIRRTGEDTTKLRLILQYIDEQ